MNLQQRRFITRRFLREAVACCLDGDLAPVALVYTAATPDDECIVSLIANRAYTTDKVTLAEALKVALAGLTAADDRDDGPDSFSGIPIGPDGGPLSTGAAPPEKPARHVEMREISSAGVLRIGDVSVHTMACPLCNRRATLGFGSTAEDVPPAEDSDLYAVCYPCKKAIALYRSLPMPYSPWPKREGWQEGGGGI